MKLRKIAAGVALAALAAVTTVGIAAANKKDVQAIEKAVAGDWRKPEAKARDAERHPTDALAFWGLKPKMTILELQPGGGWWTEILAPYAKANKGEFYATASDTADPGMSENARKARADFEARFADTATYGKVNLVNWGPNAAPLPANKFDFVLAARVFHGWTNQGRVDVNLANIYNSLKPGGVLGVEQHRGNPGQEPAVNKGYATEQAVIDAATRAGFKFDGKSEINANPKDTKDHPFGVWTLPPTRQSSEGGKPVDPAFDRAKYDAIGESDRMTLRFVKPKK
ncbi:MAG TPA: methyltransferase domain-containing protein [Steroidobacteraceae bacterium]|nr:methyltransferase domain-containing protein [Steroidobacteraceae bacterium]